MLQKVSQAIQLPEGTTKDKLAYVRLQLNQHRADMDQHNLDAWRCRLRNSPKECYKPLQNSKVTSPVTACKVIGSPHLGVSSCTEEALEVLRCHWRTVWDRPLHVAQSLQALLAEFDDTPHFDVTPLTGSDLKRAAAKQSGRAASCDGWYGTVFEHAAAILTVCETLGTVPQTWSLAKQTHIPKGDVSGAATESLAASKLRPITLLSSWSRLWGAARLQSLGPWIDSWWPDTAYGGRAGSETV